MFCSPAHKCVRVCMSTCLHECCVQVCSRACCLCVRGYMYVRARLLMRTPMWACVRQRVCVGVPVRKHVDAWACILACAWMLARLRIQVVRARLREWVLRIKHKWACMCVHAYANECACVCLPTRRSVRVWMCARLSTYASFCACVRVCCLRESASLGICVYTPACACTSVFLHAGLHVLSCALVGSRVFACVCPCCFAVSWGENKGIIPWGCGYNFVGIGEYDATWIYPDTPTDSPAFGNLEINLSLIIF